MMAHMAKRKKRWIIALSVIAALLVIVMLAAAWLLVDYAINMNADFSMCSGFSRHYSEPTPEQQWILDQSEDWTMEADGLTLHAYYLANPQSNGRYALLCHGYGTNGLSVNGFAQHYYAQGYSILIPEARAHGKSEGQYVGMGWPERMDIVRWLERLAAQDPEAPILLHGISMGGATVMMVSGEQLPASVACIVEDCGYSSVWDEFAWQARDLFGVPEFPLMYLASGFSSLRAGYDFRTASAVDQVKKSRTPTLFIHGSADTFVPFAMLDLVYEAAACEKEKLVVEGAAHGASSWDQPELYWSTVDDFIERHMPAAD